MNSTREQVRENLEPLDVDAAMEGLQRHRQRRGKDAKEAIKVALEVGDLAPYRTDIETYIPNRWLQQCKWAHGRRNSGKSTTGVVGIAERRVLDYGGRPHLEHDH